jgi:hypothetical protein
MIDPANTPPAAEEVATAELMLAATFNGLCRVIEAMARRGALSKAEVRGLHDAMFWPLDDLEQGDDPVLACAREAVEAMLAEILANPVAAGADRTARDNRSMPMIPTEAVTIEAISGLLDDAVIDWTLTEGDHLYVTGLDVPLWIEHEPDPARVTLRTYWPVRPDAGEVEVLRFANRCNAGLVMAQFWFNADLRRLSGQYTLPCRDGLDRRQFIRVLRAFAESFMLAVREQDEDNVLCEGLGDASWMAGKL